MVRQQSPGPIYALPPLIGYYKHDISRFRNPQYSISPRLPGAALKSQAPGPQYFVRGFTAYGKINPPAYSIKSRPRDLGIKGIGPGPGAYSPEKFPKVLGQTPPAYTIHGRTHVGVGSIGPGPAYNLPSTLGPKVPNLPAAGAYSMSPRFNARPYEISPGPANYKGTLTNVYKQASPKYTMSPLWQASSLKQQSPGPAAYMPKKLCGEKGKMYTMRPKWNTDITPYMTADDNVPCIQR